MSRRAVFRVDASATTGAGHLRRCCTLAEVLTASGWNATFACHPETKDFLPARAEQRFSFLWLPDGSDETFMLQSRSDCEVLVVDHYSRDEKFERTCRDWTRAIVVIDDLADRRHDCDLLVDQTPGRHPQAYAGLLPENCRVLTGSEYALVDPRFARARAHLKESNERMCRVLVSFGGGASGGATLLALRALAKSRLNAHVDIVVGFAGAELDSIKSAVGELVPHSEIHVAVQDMASLVQRADLAIGGGGMSALERCCVGVPSLIATIADNQRESTHVIARHGAAFDLGPAASLSVDDLADAIERLANDPEKRAAMARAGRDLCDGKGVERVRDAIVRQTGSARVPSLAHRNDICLRLATLDDARLVWEWRNDTLSRENSRNPDPLSWGTHLAWFSDRLASSETLMLIALSSEHPAGVVRFDRCGDVAEVSINVAPAFRFRGIGKRLLALGCDFVDREKFARILEAEISAENKTSQRVFECSGFVSTSSDGVFLRYRRYGADSSKGAP